MHDLKGEIQRISGKLKGLEATNSSQRKHIESLEKDNLNGLQEIMDFKAKVVISLQRCTRHQEENEMLQRQYREKSNTHLRAGTYFGQMKIAVRIQIPS